MQLTSEQIAKYQQLYLEAFGEPVTKEEALEQGLALVRLVKALSQPDDEKENYDEEIPANNN